ncbi:universal stress protein [Qipengyuania sp. 483]
MFERVIVAYDGKKESTFALKQAASLAFAYRAEIYLIGVVSIIPTTAMADPYPQDDFLVAGRDRLLRSLHKEAEDLRKKGMRVFAEILQGSPVTKIAAYARSIHADLVVIGHTENGWLARWFNGSIGSQLIRELPCSLLIATGEVDEIENVSIG